MVALTHLRTNTLAKNSIIVAGVFVAMIGAGTNGWTQPREELVENINNFKVLCSNSIETVGKKPFIELMFAPIRLKRDSETQQVGTWPMVFETKERQYRDNEFEITRPGQDRIHLVSILHKPKIEQNLPPYLWHVISIPTPSNGEEDRKLAGFIAEYENFRKNEEDIWQEIWGRKGYRYLSLSTKTTVGNNRILAYVNRELGGDIITRITETWQATFHDAMKGLVLASHTGPVRLYAHTFIYQDAPVSANKIVTDVGDHRDSSIATWLPGTAYGFVLDNRGDCLAWSKVELVDRSSP